MLFKNKLQNAVISTGYGIVSLLFICSFTLPGFVKYIGFGDMAAAAQEKAAVETIDSYAYYKFSTASNIDAYLGRELECVRSVARLDSLDRLPQKTILFVRYSEIRREEEFRDWINGRDTGYTQGRYSWYYWVASIRNGMRICGKPHYNLSLCSAHTRQILRPGPVSAPDRGV